MRHRIVATLGIALCVTGVVIAQELGTQPQDRDTTTQPARERTALRVPTDGTQTSKNLDAPIAACLILGNQEEMTLAKFAQQRSQNEQVKQFAQKMAQAHQQATSQLEKFAPQGVSLTLNGDDRSGTTRSGDVRTGTTRSGDDRSGTTQPRTAVNQPGRTNSDSNTGDMHHQMLEMQKAIAQECLNLTQRELSEKEGVKFDQCFMAQQIGAHIGMLAKLTGSEQYASAELQQVVEKQRQTAQQHLQMAKQIMQQLESEASTTRQ